jgi:hypothetical protein
MPALHRRLLQRRTDWLLAESSVTTPFYSAYLNSQTGCRPRPSSDHSGRISRAIVGDCFPDRRRCIINTDMITFVHSLPSSSSIGRCRPSPETECPESAERHSGRSDRTRRPCQLVFGELNGASVTPITGPHRRWGAPPGDRESRTKSPVHCGTLTRISTVLVSGTPVGGSLPSNPDLCVVMPNI